MDVRASSSRDNAVLEVRDTGMGIPADEQEHVFERFFRTSRATEQAIQGTGLGLAISKAIVDAHGGRITAREQRGRRRDLPRHDPDPRVQPAERRTGGDRLVSERPLVLVADDDPDILSLVTLRLERDGYEVIGAPDGERALEEALERTPDLALLDVSMPKLDGYEVTERLRQHEPTSATPIILLTARVQDSDVARGIDAGADDYVKKPFSTAELRTRVQAALGR